MDVRVPASDQEQRAQTATGSTPGRVGDLAHRAAGWGQRIWDVITVVGAVVVSGFWYWYSGLAETDPDARTCVAIIALPLALILLRRQIDQWVLARVQPVLGKIPSLVRLGVGLATPFLVSNYLYTAGYSQFDYMFRSVVISTLASYFVLRRPGFGSFGSGSIGRTLTTALVLGSIAQLVGLLSPDLTAFADDCSQDITRAEDCLRTPGFAQGLATGVSTVITILVNGANVGRTVFPPAGGDGQGGEDEEPAEYTLDVRTTEGLISLYPDGQEVLWVYGQVGCNKPEVDTASLTSSLTFTQQGPNADWLLLDPPQMSDGFKAVAVRARPPSPESPLLEGGPQVAVSALIEGNQFTGTVALSLESFYLEIHPIA